MNRLVLFGVAIFFAVVGLALIGAEKKAVAGHGCHGCSGACDGGHCDGKDGCHGDCGGRRCHGHHRRNRCNGCNGRRHRCHGRDRCHGGCNGGKCDGYDCGGKGYEDGKGAEMDMENGGGEEPPPPPPDGEEGAAEGTSASVNSAPAYRTVAFRN